MLIRYFVASTFSTAILLLNASALFAQNYPNKPVRIVTSEVGGSTDFTARLIAPALTNGLGQQVIVENRGGVSGIIAITTVTKAPADGYTVLLYTGTLWLLPFLRDNVPYDPVKDLAPITLMTRAPNILVIHPSLPVKSVKELIALAKSRPGQLNYGSSGTGSSTHLAAELFKSMAGIDMVSIPYKGGGPAINALVGGQVQLMFATAGSVAPHVKSARLKALAVTSAQPSELLPSLPTVAATVPGYELTAQIGVFAPAKTPTAIINRLNQEIVRLLKTPETKDKFMSAGAEVVGSSPEQLAATMTSEMTRLGKVITDAKIRAD